MVKRKVQMYTEKGIACYDPHSNPVCVCGGGITPDSTLKS